MQHCTAFVGEELRLLVADHCASPRAGRSSLGLMFAFIATVSQVGLPGARIPKMQGSRFGSQFESGDSNGVLGMPDGADASEAKVFRAHAPPREFRVCSQVAAHFASWWR